MVDSISPSPIKAQGQNDKSTLQNSDNQPHEVSIQTQDSNVQSQEGNVQSQEDSVQNQVSQRAEIRRLQPKELRLIDEVAQEKALQFMRNRRELMGDSPLVIRPYENEYQAKRRTHAAEMHMYNLVLKDYLVKLQNEALSDSGCHQTAELERSQANKITELETQVAELKREIYSKKDRDSNKKCDSSNQASSSQNSQAK